jgi:CRISPR-associated endonuclease/helicase Cas3
MGLELKDCWAKTNKQTGYPVLGVQEHCLTIGFVAQALFNTLSTTRKIFLPKGWATTVAAHDLGKLTPGFQLKAAKWKYFDEIRGKVIQDNMVSNHAIVSQWYLQSLLSSNDKQKVGHWFISTGGHHGSYPFGFKGKIGPVFEGGIDWFVSLRKELLGKLIQVFGSLPSESGKGEEERVHYLTGFTILADWIGSNMDDDWFPSSLGSDPEALKSRAIDVVDRLGLNAQVKHGLSFGEQFAPSAPDGFTPRELQSMLLKASDSPGLYVVEAPMGIGKTEAALSAAYKRWTEGEEKGLYFALPTQLTSNKIHDRITSFLENTLGKAAVQTLVHGNAWLSEKSTQTLTPKFNDEASNSPELDHNDTDEVLLWYSDSRKALIAPFGTGTIDQALLAVLPARFAALRYFALAGKVVVIDEVHSYDPYMSNLIDRLINHLLKAGSTVIILSATLTAKRRAALVAAAGAKETTQTNAYPLITKVSTGSIAAQHFAAHGKLESKTVRLHHYFQHEDTENDFWEDITGKVEAGANVVVIRNSVALAQHTYRLLKSLLTETIADEGAGLLHSRFPRWYRTKNEEHWIGILGKDESRRPNGSLLVSTQIVEQSVDIDADLLVTDLAPTDLVLQRIGRLHRHSRKRPSGFEIPTCYLLHPNTDWSGRAKEVKAALAPHGYVYPPLTLWQATAHLAKLSKISLPVAIRDILENSAALAPPSGCSSALKEFAEEYQRGVHAQEGTARVRGVFNAVAIEDHEGRETRYNVQASSEVVLLVKEPIEQAGSITLHLQYGSPISFRVGEFSFRLAKALQLNAVRIPAYLIKDQITSAPEWLQQHLSHAVLAILSKNGTQLKIIPDADSIYQLHFHPKMGLTYEKADAMETYDQTAEPEDFWF